MLNIMLDLETLGNKPEACILSIGACIFDPVRQVVDSQFYSHIELEDSIRCGFKVDASTINWWMRQDREARQEAFAFPANQSMRVVEALTNFGEWIYEHCNDPKDVRMWGNGSDFDNVLLESAYKKLSMPSPWNFKGNRCYRTVKSIFRNVPYPDIALRAHVAVDDAIYQAIHLMEIAKVHRLEL